MGFFQDLKMDLSQAVNELMPEEENKKGGAGLEDDSILYETLKDVEATLATEVGSFEEGIVENSERVEVRSSTPQTTDSDKVVRIDSVMQGNARSEDMRTESVSTVQPQVSDSYESDGMFSDGIVPNSIRREPAKTDKAAEQKAILREAAAAQMASLADVITDVDYTSYHDGVAGEVVKKEPIVAVPVAPEPAAAVSMEPVQAASTLVETAPAAQPTAETALPQQAATPPQTPAGMEPAMQEQSAVQAATAQKREEPRPAEDAAGAHPEGARFVINKEPQWQSWMRERQRTGLMQQPPQVAEVKNNLGQSAMQPAFNVQPDASQIIAEPPQPVQMVQPQPVMNTQAEVLMQTPPVVEQQNPYTPPVQQPVQMVQAATTVMPSQPAANAALQQPVQEEPQSDDRRLDSPQEILGDMVSPAMERVAELQEGAKNELIDLTGPAVEETSVVEKGMTLAGDLYSKGSVELLGTVNGNIHILGKLTVSGKINGDSHAGEVLAESANISGNILTEGTVKLGENSVVIGDIRASSAVVAGAVKGNLDVAGPVILDSTAVIMGNIKSKSVQISSGAIVEGMCSQAYADVDVKAFFN